LVTLAFDMDEAKFGHFDARRSSMRAIACCPVRVDALAMYDASDAPRMESPTESKGSSIGVEEAASSEDSEADARRRRGEVTRDVGASASRGREATLRRSVNDALMALKQRKRTGRVVTRSGSRAPAGLAMPVRAPSARKKSERAVFETYENLAPLNDPETVMVGVLVVLRGAAERAWEERLEAIALANRLVIHHVGVVSANLRPFIIGVTSCLESLRSSISKAALSLIKTLAVHLKGKINGELGCVFPSVLKRASESSFLSAEADEVLHVLIEAAAPHAVIRTLSQHVSESRRLQAKIAFALTYCVERNAECASVFRGRAGRTALDLTLATLDVCIRGGHPDARLYAKRCLSCLIDVLGSDGLEKPMRAYPDLFAFEESGNASVY
jgi:hypothetical protein